MAHHIQNHHTQPFVSAQSDVDSAWMLPVNSKFRETAYACLCSVSKEDPGRAIARRDDEAGAKILRYIACTPINGDTI